jgi:hypothetical protein
MSHMAVSGAGIAAIAAGAVFAYGGIKGYSIARAFQNVVLGKAPATGQNAASLTGPAASATGTTGSVSGGSGGAGSGAPATGPATGGSGSVAQYQAYAFSLFPQYGWGADQQQPLINLWNQESGWDPKADNPSSGAYGIPQSLPAAKMASAGSDYLTNGFTQIRWGLGYIHGTYVNPAGAWAHEQSNNWY